MRSSQLIALMMCVALGSGCGGDTAQQTGTDDKPSMQGGVRPDSRPVVTLESLGGTARVHGVVRFEGDLPKSREVGVAGDKYCVEKRGASFIDPDVIVNEEGGVQNVFVYLQGGVPEYRFAVPETAVTVDQNDCQYEPRVLGVQVGQKLRFSNNDQTLHNVHSVVDKNIGNKPFNFGMPGRKGVIIEKTFESSEIMARIKCDVHPWMVAWVGVLPHPWYSVTDATGAFDLDQVPDGEYIVAAWHERLGQTSARIQVQAGASRAVEIVFPPLGESGN